ncbi:MAG TPA: DUF192 domain-containing protein [Edaphobacter sp.]|nr:DUF192 domain-containing protein [Edaphobacter sp.]
MHCTDQIALPGWRALAEGEMERCKYCAYNETRECFLSFAVTVADSTFARLRELIGKLKLGYDEGIWVMSSGGVSTLGVVFPHDLVYLDENHRVVHLVEYFRAFRIVRLRTQAASVLQLPTHTIYSSQTQVGDQLVICAAEEMEHRLGKSAAVQLRSQSE